MPTLKIALCIAACLIAVCVAPRAARADIFLLSSGGQVEGSLVNRGESPRLTYVVKTTLGGVVTLPSNQVKKVVSRNDAKQRYDDLLPKMPNTGEGHGKMAEWCLSHGLDSEREYHLRELLKFDPENEVARRVLGFQKRDGRWLTMDEIMVAQGMVRHQGKWRYPQDIELHAGRDNFKKDEIFWRNKVKSLHNKIRTANGDKAFEELKAIRHPAASAALADLLDNPNEPREMRRVYVDVLGRLNSGTAISALCHCALADADDTIRDKCLDVLVEMGDRQPIAFFISKLDEKKNDNSTVNRAGVALGRFKDKEATLPLIDALVTSHKRTVQGNGGGISMGAGGLSVGGGGPKTYIDTFENDGVLSGLTATCPGVNFSYDKAAWRNWYAESSTPKSVQLRRDP